METQTSVGEFQAADASARTTTIDRDPGPYELVYSGRHKGLLRLKRWVAQHGALTLTLSQAAELACLTPQHFSSAFHKHTGQTFKRWRYHIRMRWAVIKMEAGQHSIIEVMHLAGYRDRRAFERAIKLVTGATPGCIGRNRVESSGLSAFAPKSRS